MNIKCIFVSAAVLIVFLFNIYWVDAEIIEDLKPWELKSAPVEEEKD